MKNDQELYIKGLEEEVIQLREKLKETREISLEENGRLRKELEEIANQHDTLPLLFRYISTKARKALEYNPTDF